MLDGSWCVHADGPYPSLEALWHTDKEVPSSAPRESASGQAQLAGGRPNFQSAL